MLGKSITESTELAGHKSILKKEGRTLRRHSKISWGHISLKEVMTTPDSCDISEDEREEQKAKAAAPIQEKINLAKPKFSLSEMLLQDHKPITFNSTCPPARIVPQQTETSIKINKKGLKEAIKLIFANEEPVEKESEPKKYREVTLSESKLTASTQDCAGYSVKSQKVLKSESEVLREYFLSRFTQAKELVEQVIKKQQKISQKQGIIDKYISETLPRATTTESELSRIKAEVCKTSAYRYMVNSYLFYAHKLGWRILDGFMQFPCICFSMVPFPILLRATVYKKSVTSPNSIFSSDALLKKLSFELKDLQRWNPKLAYMALPEFKATLEAALDSLASELQNEFKLNNALLTGSMRQILWEATGSLRELAEYFQVLTQLSKEFAISGPYYMEEGKTEYSVTISDIKERFIVAYKVKADVRKLSKLQDTELTFINVLNKEGKLAIERISKEIESAMKEKIGTMQTDGMLGHFEFAEFMRRFLSSY